MRNGDGGFGLDVRRKDVFTIPFDEVGFGSSSFLSLCMVTSHHEMTTWEKKA
jgi:hypothetical protein